MTTATETRPPPALALAPGGTVLVPLDGSEEAARAWPVARALAAIHEARLRALFLGPEPVDTRALPGLLGLDEADLRGAIIDQATGAPGSAIVRSARERPSGLVVTSTHFEAARPEGTLGPFLKRLLTGCRCPIVLVPKPFRAETFQLDRILLPQDGTPTMAFAIAPALALAARSRAWLYVLHVTGFPAREQAERGSLHVPRYIDQAPHEWPAWTREFLCRIERLGRAPTGTKLRMHLAHGIPSLEIARFAEEHEVSLIVLAWRGSLNRDRALTLRNVLCRAPCPVLVLRSA